jgi:hypothetical protein
LVAAQTLGRAFRPDASATGSQLESSLADLHGLLGEGVGPEVAAALADRIMPQTGVSAFNSSLIAKLLRNDRRRHALPAICAEGLQ